MKRWTQSLVSCFSVASHNLAAKSIQLLMLYNPGKTFSAGEMEAFARAFSTAWIRAWEV